MFDFLKSSSGKWSLTKIGGAIISLAGIVLALPTAGVSVPIAIIAGAKIVGAVAVAIGANGVRNAIDNSKRSANE